VLYSVCVCVCDPSIRHQTGGGVEEGRREKRNGGGDDDGVGGSIKFMERMGQRRRRRCTHTLPFSLSSLYLCSPFWMTSRCVLVCMS
jgi:hypothetical protein